MFYSTNLSREASTLTKWLVSIPSVAHAKGPSLINQAIYEGLREFPYFKNHQEHLTLIPHVDANFDDENISPRSTKSSVVALVKSLEEVSDTLVLLCDTDTSSPYHYGMFKGSSTSCDDLALKLRQLAEQGAVSSKIEEILKSDSGLFGLGILESKCATGAMIAVLKELSDNYVHLNLNILFVCTCEGSIQHRGIKQCIPFIEQLCHNENLTLRLAVNAKPNTPVNRHDRGLHLYSGSYGKIEPSFYIIGSSATAFRPYDGFSASIIASELIRELELNPKLTQRLHHKPLVPTFDSLRVKEFGKDFSPDGMQVSFSLPLLALNLGDLLEILKEVAATAIEHAAELVDHRESSYAQLVHEDFIPEAKDAEVISFSDLVERARHNFPGNLDKALTGMVQKCRHEGLSLHQASITIIERLNEIARLPRPSIVIYYTDNYVPPMSLEPSDSKDRELFMLLEGLLTRMHGVSPLNPTLVPYYAPTDGNFLRPVGHEAAFDILNEECPVRAQELTTLNVPTITIGIQGDDLTQLTEHVTRDMCEYLPRFLLNLVDLMAQPENALGLAYHNDVEHHLAELGRRAESIANASVREIQTINQQNASTGFYAQVNQGTLTPHSLSTFLRQFQQGEPGTLQRQEAQLSLPLNPDASKENSAEFTPETELITVTPAEVVATQPNPDTKEEAETKDDAAAATPQELQLELKQEEESKSVKGNKAVRAVKSIFKKAQEAKQALEDNIQESSVEQAADAPISLVAGHHYKGTNKQDAAPMGPSAIDVALEAASAIAQMANPDQPDPSTQEPADIDRLAPFTHAPKPVAQPETKPDAKADSGVEPVADEDESAELIVTPVTSVVTPAPETKAAEPKSKQAKGKKKKKGAKHKEAAELKLEPKAAPTSAKVQASEAKSTVAKSPATSKQATDTKSAVQLEKANAPEPAAKDQTSQPAASKAASKAQSAEQAKAQPKSAVSESNALTTESQAASVASSDTFVATAQAEPESKERADAKSDTPNKASADATPEPKAELAAPQEAAAEPTAEHTVPSASASTLDAELKPESVEPATDTQDSAAQATEPEVAPAASAEVTSAEHQPEAAKSAEQVTKPTAQEQHDQPENGAETEALTTPEQSKPTKTDTKEHAPEAEIAPESERKPEAPAPEQVKSKGTEPVPEAQPVDLTANKSNLAPEAFFAALAAAPVAAKEQTPAKEQTEDSASSPSGFFAQALAATAQAPEPEVDRASAQESAPVEPEKANAAAEPEATGATSEAINNAPETSDVETEVEPEFAPESGAETASESGADIAPESDAEITPASDAEITPASGAETTSESGADVAPKSDVEVALASGAETTSESGADVAPKSDVEVAPATDAETATESGVEVAPDSDVEVAPATDAETATESGVEVAPESDVEIAPANGAETATESGVEVAPESDVEIAPANGAETASESGADVAPDSDVEVAPASGADLAAEKAGETTAADVSNLDATQGVAAEAKRDDTNLGNDLKSAVDSIESALSSSLSKVSSFFKGKSKLKSSLNKLQEQVKETIEQEKPKAEHHILTSPEPELNLEHVKSLGTQDTYVPVTPSLPENQVVSQQAAYEQAPEPQVPVNAEPQAETIAQAKAAPAQGEIAAPQAESTAPAAASAELDESLERELEALVQTESELATDAVIAALRPDDDAAKTIEVVAPPAPAFDLAKLTTAQVTAPEPEQEPKPEPAGTSTNGNTIITRSPQIKPSKPVFISAKTENKAPSPTEAKAEPTEANQVEAKPAPTQSKPESAPSKESKAKPEVSADMVAQLMAEAVSKKFKEHKLAQIDTTRTYSDSNRPFANGVYANDINVDLPSSQIFDPTSDTALEADALSQELQGDSSGSLHVPQSEATPGFAPDADAEPMAPPETAQVPLNQLFAQAQKELQGSAVARHLRGAHEPFAPDAPEQIQAAHPEFAPDRDAEQIRTEPSADELIAATHAPQQPESAVAVAAPVQPQVKAELDAELASASADGPTLKRYDPAQAYAELLLDDDEQYQARVVNAQEQKAQAEAQRVSAKQQALDAATATALGDMMNDDFSAQDSTPSASAAVRGRTPSASAAVRGRMPSASAAVRGRMPTSPRRTSSDHESLSARRAALRRAMYGDDADLAPRKPVAPAPAQAPVNKGSYIDLNQQGKVVSYNPDEFTKTMSARTQNATASGVVGAVHAGPVGSNYDSMVQGTVQGASATAPTASTASTRPASLERERPVSSVNYGSSRLSSTRSSINPSTRASTPSRSTTAHSSHRFSPNSRLGILDDEPMVGNAGRNMRPPANKSVGTVIGAPTTSSASQNTRTSTRTSERTTATSALKRPETGRSTTARPAPNSSTRSNTKVETLASSNPGVRILRTTTTQPTPKAKPVRPRNEVVYSQGGAVVISQRITADQASTYLNQNHESKESHLPTAPTAIAGSTASLRRTAEQSLNTSFKRMQEDKSISGTIVIRSDPNKRNK